MKATSAAIIVLAAAVLMHTNSDVLVAAGMLIGAVGLVTWVVLISMGSKDN